MKSGVLSLLCVCLLVSCSYFEKHENASREGSEADSDPPVGGSPSEGDSVINDGEKTNGEHSPNDPKKVPEKFPPVIGGVDAPLPDGRGTTTSQKFYVRPKGESHGLANGSDWANAFSGLPASLVRGATYYLADGTYDSYTFDDAASGDRLIVIKKATISDHGTDTGWTNSLGGGQALFSGQLTIKTAYYLIDGQVRDPSRRTGYGIKINASASKGIYMRVDGTNYISIRFVEIEGRGPDGAASPANDLVYINSESHFFLLQNSYLHFSGRTFIIARRSDDALIEKNLFSINEDQPTQHSEGFSVGDVGVESDRWIIRNNIFEDTDGVGLVVFKGDGYEIYGNLAYNAGLSPIEPIVMSSFGGWNSNPTTGDDYRVNNVKIYNNTFVNLVDPGVGFTGGSTNVTVYNNIFYKCGEVNHANVTNDYNLYYQSPSPSGRPVVEAHVQNLTDPDIFKDSNSFDFRLKKATDSGLVEPSMNAIDPFGVIRGTDGSWDRGAFEF